MSKFVSMTNYTGAVLALETHNSTESAREGLLVMLADLTRQNPQHIVDNCGMGTIVLAEGLEYAYTASGESAWVSISGQEYQLAVLEDARRSWAATREAYKAEAETLLRLEAERLDAPELERETYRSRLEFLREVEQ